jgi:hypothetical protein
METRAFRIAGIPVAWVAHGIFQIKIGEGDGIQKIRHGGLLCSEAIIPNLHQKSRTKIEHMGDGACLAPALARLLTLSGSPQKGRHGPMPGVGGPALAVPRRAK